MITKKSLKRRDFRMIWGGTLTAAAYASMDVESSWKPTSYYATDQVDFDVNKIDSCGESSAIINRKSDVQYATIKTSSRCCEYIAFSFDYFLRVFPMMIKPYHNKSFRNLILLQLL